MNYNSRSDTFIVSPKPTQTYFSALFKKTRARIYAAAP